MGTTDLSGRVAVVTGAGAGLGRAEALALAVAGADVVVNDVGDAADTVVAEIQALGRRAIAVKGDVSDWQLGATMVEAAVAELGSLDIVVNNAGIIRDGMLFNLTEKMWDDVIRVHLKGHAALCHAASVHWRAQAKSTGNPVSASIVNTASEAFLFGGPGQSNYAAAKSGIVALTLSVAQGMSRYGVRANAIAPRARTEMTAHVFEDPTEAGGLDILAPERVGTMVSYLASDAAAQINGQVFVVYGDMVALLAPPTVEQKFTSSTGAFSTDELAQLVSPYFEDRPAAKNFAARSVAALDTTGVGNKS
ncbi:SDR family NAD(P)-dependent oxidoreductase [Nocardioides sp. Bht2]|uniref:SDR family NAD(P)-dependent oxidoreductase n=1 Tax=Nocardioides sp. Bht2 TaxID=3392297 RepID=UPI0039B5BF0B